jgi:hypothetical protein
MVASRVYQEVAHRSVEQGLGGSPPLTASTLGALSLCRLRGYRKGLCGYRESRSISASCLGDGFNGQLEGNYGKFRNEQTLYMHRHDTSISYLRTPSILSAPTTPSTY